MPSLRGKKVKDYYHNALNLALVRFDAGLLVSHDQPFFPPHTQIVDAGYDERTSLLEVIVYNGALPLTSHEDEIPLYQIDYFRRPPPEFRKYGTDFTS